MTALTRRCAKTGLQLIANDGRDAFHVAKTGYAPLSAAPRGHGEDPYTWGRYDIVGATYYLASARACAYAEVLASFKRPQGAADPLAADAAALGMTLAEFIEEIATEWAERDFMGLGAIPAAWRLDRGVYQVTTPTSGWIVDIEHPDSLAALESTLGSQLGVLGVTSLTTGVLRGERRDVTTMLAEWIHSVPLDDGTLAMGVHFGSKHGSIWWCRAYWLDHSRAAELIPLSPEPVLVTDPDLVEAADRFRIKVF